MAGAALLTLAAWMFHPPLAPAVAGVACVLIGLFLVDVGG